MKKMILVFVLFTVVFAVNAQDYSILRYGSTNSETLSVGDFVYVPLIVDEFSSDLVVDFSSGIEFDNSVLNYDTIISTNPNMSNSADWTIVYEGNSVGFVWFDPTFSGVPVNAGDTLCEIVFTYSGGETGLLFGEGAAINTGGSFLCYTIDGCVCSNPSLPAIFHVSSNSLPLEGSGITIEQETQQTDSLGISIFNLTPDIYSYVVSKPGYENYEGSFEVANTTQIINVDLQESTPSPLYYQTVFPCAEVFFEADTAYSIFGYPAPRQHVLGLKVIDSTVVENSTFYFFYNEFHDENYSQVNIPVGECVHNDAYSWSGPGFQVFANGLNVFFNRNYDSLFIYTQAELGDSWTFYSDSTGNEYIATITDISIKNFLGVTDTVKTISIEGENSYSLELSQNYGLLKTFNFRDFPYFGEDSYQVYQYDLIGLSNPAIGYQKMSLLDVYDYEVGDEVHWTNEYGASGVVFEVYYIDKISGKQILNGDTVQYVIDRTSWYTDPVPPGDFHYSQNMDTMNVYNTPAFGGKLPLENIGTDEFLDRYVMYQTSYNNRMVMRNKTLGYGFQWVDTNCYNPYAPMDYSEIFYYIKGVGSFGGYEGGSGGDYTYLKYFKKGDETWGTPLEDPLGISPNSSDRKVVLFPNPVEDFLYIRANEDAKIEKVSIFDPQGKIIYEKSIAGNLVRIDVRKWNKGMYFYQIHKRNAVLEYGKFVVR